MKRSIQLVALLLTVFMGSCTGGKDKAAAEHVDAKPIVKLADVKARPVDQIQDYTATVEAEVKNNIAPSSPYVSTRFLWKWATAYPKARNLCRWMQPT